MLVFLTPLCAPLFGALWLGQPVTPSLLGAVALIANGIVQRPRSAHRVPRLSLSPRTNRPH